MAGEGKSHRAARQNVLCFHPWHEVIMEGLDALYTTSTMGRGHFCSWEYVKPVCPRTRPRTRPS